MSGMPKHFPEDYIPENVSGKPAFNLEVMYNSQKVHLQFMKVTESLIL